MKKDSNKILSIIFRYIILLLVAIPNLYLFYLIFTPLTFYPVYILLSIFFGATMDKGIILLRGLNIELIAACIAGSAYYLLLILNLSTPEIFTKKRLKMILFSAGIFLLANILRIFFLSILALSSSSFFDISHNLSWYVGSTLFVVLIWFSEVKIFKINKIPFYSDLRFLFKKITQ